MPNIFTSYASLDSKEPIILTTFTDHNSSSAAFYVNVRSDDDTTADEVKETKTPHNFTASASEETKEVDATEINSSPVLQQLSTNEITSCLEEIQDEITNSSCGANLKTNNHGKAKLGIGALGTIAGFTTYVAAETQHPPLVALAVSGVLGAALLLYISANYEKLWKFFRGNEPEVITRYYMGYERLGQPIANSCLSNKLKEKLSTITNAAGKGFITENTPLFEVQQMLKDAKYQSSNVTQHLFFKPKATVPSFTATATAANTPVREQVAILSL